MVFRLFQKPRPKRIASRPGITRREFLRQAGRIGAGIAGARLAGRPLWARAEEKPEVKSASAEVQSASGAIKLERKREKDVFGEYFITGKVNVNGVQWFSAETSLGRIAKQVTNKRFTMAKVEDVEKFRNEYSGGGKGYHVAFDTKGNFIMSTINYGLLPSNKVRETLPANHSLTLGQVLAEVKKMKNGEKLAEQIKSSFEKPEPLKEFARVEKTN